MKKLLSLVLAVALCFGVCVPGTAAQPAETQSAVSNEMTVQGTNSFGNLLSDVIDEELDKQTENNGYNIFSVEVSGNTATVSLETVADCTLVVGIYDEAGQQMLASGHQDVTADDKSANVTIETDAMPEYFLVKAYLVDSADMTPLCTAYSTPDYTKEMQDFFAKKVTDFDADRVLNLDEDLTNNFAVFSDSVKVIPHSTTANQVVKADDATRSYVIENADSSITSLQKGDTFSYTYETGEVLIVKVGDIAVSGTSVQITGAKTEMEDIFDYVKIDGQGGLEEEKVDKSTRHEGILDGHTPQLFADDENVSGSKSDKISYVFKEVKPFDDDSVVINGSGDFELVGSVKIFMTANYKSLEVKLDYALGVDVGVAFKVVKNDLIDLNIDTFTVSPIVGVYISITPTIQFQFSGELHVAGKLHGTVGFAVNSDEGMKSLNKNPQFDAEFQSELSIFVGLSLEPSITILSEYLAECELEATLGVEVTAEMKATTEDSEILHDCLGCVDGEIFARLEFRFAAKLFDSDKLKYERKVPVFKLKICDFYYSVDRSDFGLGTCPYIYYPVNIRVFDENFKPLQGAVVSIAGKTYTTDAAGNVELFYLGNGDYAVEAYYTGYPTRKTSLRVKNAGRHFGLLISWTGSDYELPAMALGDAHTLAVTGNGEVYAWGANLQGQVGTGVSFVFSYTTPTKITTGATSVAAGAFHSAAIKTDKSLYMWGYNSGGQLGIGTTTNSTYPRKVMDNVQKVALGDDHSAALTTDGKMYIWGLNSSYQLGDGTQTKRTQPAVVMDNVKDIALGGNVSAAITEDGSLYMWGSQNEAIPGTENLPFHTPNKVMSSVKSIAIGSAHAAAITENGDLYMWGRNYEGQIGNGGTSASSVLYPTRIMQNVKAVSLGDRHSAAITEDGGLYVWGSNAYGQLGTGDTNDLWLPTQIMAGTSFRSLELGLNHSSAVDENGTLYTWGDNASGKLGNGSTTNSSSPVCPGIASAAVATMSLDGVENASFTDLTANGIYNFYAMKDKAAASPFAAENLLYIDQLTADENGALSVDYLPTETVEDADVFVVELCAGQADYTAVEVAIATVPADLSSYSEESVAALNAAMNGVVYGLKATEQAKVDAMAVAITTAVEGLLPAYIDLSIEITDGVPVSADENGFYNLTWNAKVSLGEQMSLDVVNEHVKFKRYGVYYGVSEEEVEWLTYGYESEDARLRVFDEGEDIDVYTVFGFRLKNVAADKERVAKFFITYEYNGQTYTVCSDSSMVVTE